MLSEWGSFSFKESAVKHYTEATKFYPVDKRTLSVHIQQHDEEGMAEVGGEAVHLLIYHAYLPKGSSVILTEASMHPTRQASCEKRRMPDEKGNFVERARRSRLRVDRSYNI
ncbi:hypothetical protein E4U55_006675 [Claviceps digitariae]|nr:hypothetical protein E4U55_006675 [Claviceps digitariae]